jgi:integrase
MKRTSLSQAIAFYLQSRRQLGFALESQGALLANLAHYAQKAGHGATLTNQLALAGCQVPGADHFLSRARRLETVRGFALFWAAFDPRTQVPPAGLFGPAHRRRPVHIYSATQIAALLGAAEQLPPRQSVRPLTFHTLLGLLSCTGLRISEALKLELADWEETQAVLTIRQAKFGQSRYVPLQPSASTALKSYLHARRKAFPQLNESALFLDECGRRLTYGQASATFRGLRDQLDWPQAPRPRLHDLRHTFAVNCLLGWYRRGEQEVNQKILALAVYLGHRNIRHTYWYLTAVPELLALGSARLAQALTPQKGAARE